MIRLLGPLQRIRERWPWARQFVKFCIVGLTGLAVDTAVFALFTEAIGLDPRLAAIPAFAVAVTWTYAMNRHWTFRAAGRAGAGVSYFTFVGVCLGGLALRLLTMHLLMEYAGLASGRRYYLANLGGIFVATFSNFLGSKFLAFRRPAKIPAPRA
ncbi:MAG: GtrA family protein [Candidatus Eisenbacteria bacterium]